MSQGWVLLAIESAAILAFAVSGIAEGIRSRMDAVGLATVGFVTAFGGGTLRDVLLDRRPFVWVERVEYLWLVVTLVLAAPLVARRVQRLPAWPLQWLDALGLGLFAASGTALALRADMPATVAVMMGVVTAAFGGVMRDLLCHRLPQVLSDHRPYALCALVGSGALVALRRSDVPPELALLVAAGIGTLLRMLALARGWELPRIVGRAARTDGRPGRGPS